MRKILLATAAIAFGVGVAHAQGLSLSIPATNIDPLTKLPAAQWIYMMTHEVNASNNVGKDSVFMLNATGETLSQVTCRGYVLVGPKPYISSNDTISAPVSLPAWTATAVPTEGFNKYCKDGVDAQGIINSYHGNLSAADHTFENSEWVIFKDPSQQ
jgi:hypothetical protein